MKKLIPLLFSFLAIGLYAQQTPKNDVVLKLNGDELTGKVLKINDADIEFAYAGETLTYTIKKSEIMKITFGSGRIEVFNKPAGNAQSTAAPATTLEDHHNKVAILPFSFITDGQPAADAAAAQVQNECYSMLSKHSGVYTVINPRTSDALLAKAGITKDNIRQYTMDDLCNILGVEYVVDCIITQNKTSQTVTQSNSGQLKNKNDNEKKINTYSYGTATQNYKTSVTFGVYNDKGNSVYNQDRESFWNTQDAYKNTLEYLLKRCPLYTK